MSKSLSNAKYEISRINPQTGFKETIIYTGNIRNKPKGWKIENKIA